MGRRLLCSQKLTGNPNPTTITLTLTLNYNSNRNPNSLILTGAGGEQYIENILRKSLDASKVRCCASLLPVFVVPSMSIMQTVLYCCFVRNGGDDFGILFCFVPKRLYCIPK